MEFDQLMKMYNITIKKEFQDLYFYPNSASSLTPSIYNINRANIGIYYATPLCWEIGFLREVYEELQKELPSVKKKVIAKAIRELREEYKLSEKIKLDMMKFREFDYSNHPSIKCIRIDRIMKIKFKDYIKYAFKHNRVKWHWWNNLEWGL